MIFKETWQQVLDGTKTQTRRPCHERDVGTYSPTGSIEAYQRGEYHSVQRWSPGRIITKWQVGKTYAVQPGRGKKAIGRIRITKIRRERLQEITLQDLQAELGQLGIGYVLAFFFIEIWDRSYRKPYRWEDNPEAWCLSFELAESLTNGRCATEP